MRVDDVVGNMCLSLPRRSGRRLVSSTSIGTFPPGNGIFDAGVVFHTAAPAASRAASIDSAPDRRRCRRRFRRIAAGAQLAPPPAPARAMVERERVYEQRPGGHPGLCGCGSGREASAGKGRAAARPTRAGRCGGYTRGDGARCHGHQGVRRQPPRPGRAQESVFGLAPKNISFRINDL